MKSVCTRCQGTGEVDMPIEYVQTLTLIGRLIKSKERGEKFVVASRDYKAFHCTATALSNRLDWLETHGFLQSVRAYGQRRFTLA